MLVANKSDAIAIGGKYGARATTAAGTGSIAIGATSRASGDFSIAIGGTSNTTMNVDSGYASNTYASSKNSIAIGTEANASYVNSTAIGRGTKTTRTNQIVLGTASDMVYIPGDLVVGGISVLGYDSSGSVYIRSYIDGKRKNLRRIEKKDGKKDYLLWGATYNGQVDGFRNDSDRRLKNVGEVFSGGLDKIKQLKVYNYTFKNDETKTPRVGVMAQDLQRVFPDAVTKGEDGFLRIRWEDMFYALINAVKELDTKFTALNDRIKQLEEQNKQLEKQNKELEARLSKLEKGFTTK